MTADQHRVLLRVATLPKGKDVDELLRMEGGPALFQRAIDEAPTATAWMIEHLDDRHDLSLPEGKQEAAEDMVLHLASLPAIERGEYVRQLAQTLGVPESDLRMALNECWRDRVRAGTAPSRGSGEDTPPELLRVEVD